MALGGLMAIVTGAEVYNIHSSDRGTDNGLASLSWSRDRR